MRQSLMIMVALVCLVSCGSRSDLAATGGEKPAYQLKGSWFGQFPPSEGDEGIEVHFQPDSAFFVREGQRVAGQQLIVEQNGAQVRLTLTSQTDPQNQAIFTGDFAEMGTIRGHYLNAFLGEDFDLTLVERPELTESPVKGSPP